MFKLLKFLIGVEPDGDEGDKGGGDGGKVFTQEEVNRFIANEKRNWSSKYDDYEDLKKFRMEHEQQTEAQKQKELEAQKEYEKLKEGWTKKEQEYQGILSQKEQAIKNMKIESTLGLQLNAQNAYPEAMYELKQMVEMDESGNVKIKGKDANGMDTMLSVEEGIKSFLKNKPYLVKASGRDGGDTGAGAGTTGGATGQGDDLASLNVKYQQQMMQGDYKGAKETKAKMEANFTSRQVTRTP